MCQLFLDYKLQGMQQRKHYNPKTAWLIGVYNQRYWTQWLQQRQKHTH